MITTEYRYLGLAPRDAQEDDMVCILFGCSVPVILRENEDETLRFIGECYIDGTEGVMDGQATEQALTGKHPIVDFKLK